MPTPSFRVAGTIGLETSGEGAPRGSSRPAALPQRPTGRAAFGNISRDELYASAAERAADPWRISQEVSSLCGPASFLFILASHRPAEYYKFVTDLYEKGVASVRNLTIKPGEDCRSYNPGGTLSAADWVGLAGIRDSENSVLDYDDPSDAAAGITLPSGLADWFRKAGFTSVLNETNVYLNKGESNFRDALQLHKLGHRVCLFINAYAIEQDTDFSRGGARQIFTSANHWVVLRRVDNDKDANVQMDVFTWGQQAWQVPRKRGVVMSMKNWLNNYYGFVSCQP